MGQFAPIQASRFGTHNNVRNYIEISTSSRSCSSGFRSAKYSGWDGSSQRIHRQESRYFHVGFLVSVPGSTACMAGILHRT